MPRSKPTEAVFLNVPFDRLYRPLFEAMLFAVYDCGFKPRCALETTDAGQVRVQKISAIIRDCSFGIHDISRTELDETSGLPRFNMPFELGLFLGARWFGGPAQSRKNCLTLDSERYRYQQFISDIAGQDIKAHKGRPKLLIAAVRDWLRDLEPARLMSSGSVIFGRYQRFRRQVPSWCRRHDLSEDELGFNDYSWLVWRWLEAQPPR